MPNLIFIGSSILSILTILLIITSCDNNEVEDPTETTLENTVWVFKTDTYTNCTDPQSNGTYDLTCTSTDCTTIQLVNGTLTYTEIENGITESETMSYSISGDQITINAPDGTMIFTYSISDTTLTLVGDGGDPGCTETLVCEKQ